MASINYSSLHNISADGNYCILFQDIIQMFQYNGGQELSLLPAQLTVQQFCLYPKINGYITTDQAKIQIHNLPGTDIAQEYTISSSLRHPVLDEKNDYLGGLNSDTSPNYFRIYDLTDGTMMKEIAISSWVIGQYFLANNMIFSSNGYYLPLDF